MICRLELARVGPYAQQQTLWRLHILLSARGRKFAADRNVRALGAWQETRYAKAVRLDSLVHKFNDSGLFAGKKAEQIAPVLRDAKRFPYGPFQFRTQLPKDTEYTIQGSTDLHVWTPLARGISSGETLDYVDSEAFKHSYRFYRLMADAVQSLNVIGYASITLPPGFSMLANPLEAPINNVAELFQGWPDGTTLNKFDTRLFRLAENAVTNGNWTNPSERLMPGEGAIFFNPTSDYKSHNFVGTVTQGTPSIPIPSGFSIRSSLLPQAGNLEDLGFPVADGEVIHLLERDRQKYMLHP